MNKIQLFLPGIIAIAGLILLLADLSGATINMRGADSIAGAILLGTVVNGLRLNGKNRKE